ncbi:hypothetical protein LCGC14_0998560 [marine sediment metagenome]|uniref:Uncharacterized protein n=1 Tax=marine sediment metagenome TaxID=412755 RepID=A0A0F9N3K5_9ZZZZ
MTDKTMREKIAEYQCPLWEDCTAHTDPSSHVCNHVGPHEWSYADGDECGWLEGECTESCQPIGETNDSR